MAVEYIVNLMPDFVILHAFDLAGDDEGQNSQGEIGVRNGEPIDTDADSEWGSEVQQGPETESVEKRVVPPRIHRALTLQYYCTPQAENSHGGISGRSERNREIFVKESQGPGEQAEGRPPTPNESFSLDGVQVAESIEPLL